MTYIPDPTEILDRMIEEQADLIDADGNYPCARCGVKLPPDEMYTTSSHPAAPLICGPCTKPKRGESG